MKLYRPTGQIELGLVLDADLRAWPPRLVDQPIFYPVLNFPYAAAIASNWNTKSERLVGYVTEFDVEDDHASQYERQVVGAGVHEELWVPAERLALFNEHIIGRIRVVAAYFGDGFVGHIPESGPLQGLDADAQFNALAELSDTTLHEAVQANRQAVFLHVLRWETLGDPIVLQRIREAWTLAAPELPLPQQRDAAD